MATANFPMDAKAVEKDKPADARGVGKTRVQFDLSPRAMKLFTELKDKTDAASYAEVVKNALKLYDGLITETETGAQFYASYDGAPPAPFRMFL